jgi:hypothetical protein
MGGHHVSRNDDGHMAIDETFDPRNSLKNTRTGRKLRGRRRDKRSRIP